MKKFVVSIGREIGSGGKEIAEKLAKRLNISVYDKKLLEVAAQESGLDTTAFENADEMLYADKKAKNNTYSGKKTS